jgi:hypothetical protein
MNDMTMDLLQRLVTPAWPNCSPAARYCSCRGMGAYASMPVRGMHPMVTDIASIEDAVMAYLDGRIVNHVDRSR